jgi:hypothetical protein
MLMHHPEMDLSPDGALNPLTTTAFIRNRRGQMIGACSLTLDSDDGLDCDDTFPHEVDKIRDECRLCGWRLASCWRIVTRHDLDVEACHECGRVTKQVTNCAVGSLIDHMVQVYLENQVDVCLCTFNPKHEAFYSRFLGMQAIAHSDCESGLANAPAVLMRWERSAIDEWMKTGGRMFCE